MSRLRLLTGGALAGALVLRGLRARSGPGRHLRQVLGAAPVPAVVLGPEGEVLFCNDALLALAGRRREDVLGRSYFDVLMPDDERYREMREQFAERLRENRLEQRYETEILTAGGERRLLSWTNTILRDVRGRPVATAGIGEDVTQRREAEAALQRSEQRFRGLIEHAPDAIAILDPDGTIRYESPGAERVLGFRPSELVGTNSLDYVHPDDVERTAAVVDEILATPGAQRTIEIRVRKADGSYGQIETSLANLVDDPAVGGIVGNYRDLTERRRVQAALREAEARLRQTQKLESVARLAGGVAHEFNNLLTAIIGYGEFLRARVADDPPARAEADEVLRAAERAAALTRQLLTFARRQELEPARIDLNDVVRGVSALLGRVHDGVEIRLDLAAEPCETIADRARLEQALVELAANAAEAAGRRGTVTISTRAERERVVLAVADDGPGIAPAEAERVFDPFYTTKELGEGTGLGLATVHGIVAQSGGEIGLESEPGRGSTFSIRLPRLGPADADADDPPAEDADPPPPPRHGPGRTALVAEDDDLVRMLLLRTLEAGGFAVHAAPDGRAALELAAELDGPLDLLVTDIVLPRLNGRELAAELAARRPGLRVLFVSAYADDPAPRRVASAAATDFLSKPFTAELLRERLRRLLDD